MQASKAKAQASESSALPEEEDKDHFPLDFVRGNYKKYVTPLLIYLLIALIVFWPVTFSLTNQVAGGSGDVYGNFWNMWWVPYAIFTLHTSPYFTNLLYYPMGANLVTQTLSPLIGLLSYPFQAISIAFGFNIVFFADFMLSGFFMYLLADYIVKNNYAAFIAGIIFAFSPFHLAHAFFGQINWVSIEFFPLFILFFLLMIRYKKPIYSLCAAISFVFLLFLGDPEQGIITIVFVFFLLIFYAIKSTRREILNKKFVLALTEMIIGIFLIGAPFLVPITTGILKGALSQALSSGTDIASTMALSAPLLSFFLPNPTNNFFSWLSNYYSSIFAANPIERVAYIGYVVLGLSLVGIIFAKKKNQTTLFWVATAIIFGALTLGPYLQIGQLPNSISMSVPGPYLIFKSIPVLAIIREPSRFELVITLCLAVLAALGFKEIAERAKVHFKINNPEYYAAIIFVTLILIEYSGVPFQSSFINTYFINTTIPSSYYKLAQAPENLSVLFLPGVPTHTTSKQYYYLTMSMYYQTAFAKPIVGGVTSRENLSDQYQRLNVPLSVEALSLQTGGSFEFPSPIDENNTNVTLYFLSKYHAGFISVINEAFNATDLLLLDNYISSVFGPPSYSDSAASIWSVSNKVQSARNKSIVAYISQGNWTHGCSGLGVYFCNSTQDTLWYGPNVRAINVTVPQNKTKLFMSFTTASLNDNVTLYLFQTSDKHQLGAAKLTNVPETYALNLTLNPGTTALFFVALNLTNPTFDQTFDFGLKNITFQPR